MVAFPQRGACLCGDIVYSLTEEPFTLYACHCTDCQSATGASFSLSMIVRRGAIAVEQGSPSEFAVELPDGRQKQARFCDRCSTRLWSNSRTPGLTILEPGGLYDTSWFGPVAHIWTRSAQPWFTVPEGALNFSQRLPDDQALSLVEAWKRQQSS